MAEILSDGKNTYYELSDFQLDDDDVYDARCAEIFITLNRVLVFHCSYCNKKYGSFGYFLEHLSLEHYEKIKEQEIYESKPFENILPDLDQVTEESNDAENRSQGPLDEALHEYDELQYTEKFKAEEIYESIISDDGSLSEFRLNSEEYLKEIENVVILQKPDNRSDETRRTRSTGQVRLEEKLSSRERSKSPRVPSSTNANRRTLIHTNASEEKLKPKTRKKGLFKCDICSKTFFYKYSLNHHLIIHSSERKHNCEHCGFAFKDPSNLKSHVLRCHTGQKNFGCDFCSKKFFTKTESEAHMRTHTRENPYICSFCGLGFQTVSRMTAHSRRHTMKAPLQCSYCNKDFWDKGQLKDHLTVHTKEKPHACPICSARFPRRKSMLRHTKLHEK